MSTVEPPPSPEPTRKTSLSALATLAAVKSSNDPYASRERHHNEGHGRRLTAAFEALEAFPMLAESRNRVLRLFESGEPSTAPSRPTWRWPSPSCGSPTASTVACAAASRAR